MSPKLALQTLRGAAIGAAVAGLLTPLATAADELPLPGKQIAVAGNSAGGSEWTFGIAPYVWAAGIKGDTAQFGAPAVEVDAKFTDLFDVLDFAAMVVGEARNGPYGVMMDFIYTKLSTEVSTPAGILIEDIEMETETLAFTVAPEYRVFESQDGSLDFMGGARLWGVKTKITTSGGRLGGSSATDEEYWVDPLIGAKGRVNFTPEFYLSGWAMIGGFGVSSDFMWDTWAGFGYQFNDSIAAVLGFRATGVDYQDGPFLYDVVQYGPVAGAVFRF
jgi:hypothetical protein